MAKVDSLLARLRGEEAPPPEEAPPLAAAPAAAQVSDEQLAPLRTKIEELEQKLLALQAPPAPPVEEAPAEEPPLPPPPTPPAPPTELTLFLHTKVELLERKLELAQQEAVRANIVLREREEAQRKAQKEVEELFHSMREQQRAVAFDRQLREQYALAQHRIEDLGARLAMAELRMLPVQDVLSLLEKENGAEDLKQLLRARVEGAKAAGLPQAPSVPAAPASRPAEAGPDAALPPIPVLAPTPALRSGSEGGGAAPGAQAPEPAPERPLAPPDLRPMPLPELSVVMGKMADLERRLEESEKARMSESQKRLSWESGVLQALKQSAGKWFRGGGPELLVEAALETLVESMQKRDELSAEMTKTIEALRQEPPGSMAVGALRARLADLRRSLDTVQLEIDKRMAVVNAWVERHQGGKGA